MIDDDDALNGGEDDIVATLSAAYDKQTAEGEEAAPVAEVVAADEPKETAEEKQERIRDEKGRFAKTEQPQEEAGAQGEAKTQPEPAAAEGAPAAPSGEAEVSRPPPGWSPASKAVFDGLPASVKADIAKREIEIDAGMRRYSGLGQYAEEAERAGTSLGQYVAKVRQIDKLFTSDPLRGFDALLQSYNLDPKQVVHALSARYGVAFQQPDQEDQSAHQQAAIDPRAIAAQAAEIARLEVRAEFENREMMTKIASFEADPANKFYANVKPTMAALLQSGQAATLQEAYDKACWLNPEVRDVLIKEAQATQAQTQSIAQKAAAASQARQATKSITGAPTHGAKPANAPERSLEDTLRDAWEASAGAV